MGELAAKSIRVLVVWEPVLPTDWGPPSTAALARISDTHAIQFWDHKRLLSHLLGEHNRSTIVWDHIAVYPPGAVWAQQPPQSLFADGPVVRVIGPAKAAISRALRKN